MTTELRFRRGTAAQNNTFTGASGEVTVDTTNKQLRVHDGVTPGGTATSVGTATLILAATSKTTPVDADLVGIVDSAASNVLKKLTWANLKATLLATWKDATSGLVGLTGFSINFKNAAGTFTSFFANANTASLVYTFPDKAGTVALTSDVVTPQGNRVINGSITTDFRNLSAAMALTTGFQFAVDRLAVIATAAVTGTLTTQRILESGLNYLRLARSTGTWVGSILAYQVIETNDIQDLGGKLCTFSFNARKGSSSSATMVAEVYTGSGTNQGLASANSATWTGFAAQSGPAVSLTTTSTRYSASIALPAGTSEAAVRFQVTWASGTGDANDYVDLTDIQLEEGPLTPYQRRPVDTDRRLCARFFRRLSTYVGLVTAPACFPILMRAAPTITGGGAGFSSTGTTGDMLICSQTTGAIQPLVLEAEL